MSLILVGNRVLDLPDDDSKPFRRNIPGNPTVRQLKEVHVPYNIPYATHDDAYDDMVISWLLIHGNPHHRYDFCLWRREIRFRSIKRRNNALATKERRQLLARRNAAKTAASFRTRRYSSQRTLPAKLKKCRTPILNREVRNLIDSLSI